VLGKAMGDHLNDVSYGLLIVIAWYPYEDVC